MGNRVCEAESLFSKVEMETCCKLPLRFGFVTQHYFIRMREICIEIRLNVGQLYYPCERKTALINLG